MSDRRDMYSVYSKMDEKALRTLRSKKVLRMNKIAGFYNYFAMQEKRKLAYQISAIDVELERRALQQELL